MLYLIRYSEIGLKSNRVRKQFENFLLNDIKNALKYYGMEAEIRIIDGRIIIEGEKFLEEILKEIGGIKSFSPVILTSANIKDIKERVIEFSSFIKENESFALRVRRTGKHNFSSRDVAIVVGNAIRIARKANVDLTNPDHEIFIEIRQRNAFIFRKVIHGIAGLPYSSQGKVIAFIENMEDIKAAWLMMRRGCHIDFCITFDIEKEIKKMMKWRCHTIFRCNSITEVEKIALETEAKAIVVGNKNFMKLSIPIFYPLLGEEYIRMETISFASMHK